MKLTIVILYQGYPAHYVITRDGQGIYHARLLRYDGPDGVTPPEDLTLVRCLRRWIGSYNEAWFVAELGKALESTSDEVGPTAGRNPAPCEDTL